MNTTNNLTLTDVSARGVSARDGSARDGSAPDLNAPVSEGCACGGCGCGAAEATSDADATTGTATQVTATQVTTVTQTFGVTGMTCAHCVASVTEELSDIAGVESVTIDLNVGGASSVTVLSDAPLTTNAVRAAVEDAGYELVTPTA